ncbi:NifB/NifX family molybdenum-iron cluster-binding protein [Myxococcota bacterium]|nr:NifB/NifX family molybdenum-iron cluster-binding protein [Myxococcota bacterium]MBU1381926.1 NifB/NifX family molybdenum-iron cluster-binding protein [Myxococcota bacterium]MBU1497827.1 NifB/NifX family molybdenum-iron cluster-binding protein [Myxococcota bacterium]
MKTCVPVTGKDPENSNINPHFGSASFYAVYDSEKDTIIIEDASKDEHEHGMCNPAQTVMSHGADSVIVSGIGFKAIQKLNAAGIKVFQAETFDLMNEINKLKNGLLKEFDSDSSCHGH